MGGYRDWLEPILSLRPLLAYGDDLAVFGSRVVGVDDGDVDLWLRTSPSKAVEATARIYEACASTGLPVDLTLDIGSPDAMSRAVRREVALGGVRVIGELPDIGGCVNAHDAQAAFDRCRVRRLADLAEQAVAMDSLGWQESGWAVAEAIRLFLAVGEGDATRRRQIKRMSNREAMAEVRSPTRGLVLCDGDGPTNVARALRTWADSAEGRPRGR